MSGSSPARPTPSCWRRADLPWPADLYLEGSDQHRGWFQSSLLEAVGTRGVAPFKAVLTHGFVHRRAGPEDVEVARQRRRARRRSRSKYGADILRLWVMMSDTAEDLRIGPEILKQQAELYRRLRNTLRWLLGSLAGFTEAERVPEAEMPELERWVLHRLTELDARIRAAVESYDWTGVYPELHNFCATDLSAFYFDIRKDAIYCDRPDSLRRRAARTVLDHLHRCLTTWLAPVLCFTAEEAWGARFGDDDSVHLQLFPDAAGDVARRRAGGEVGDDPRHPPAHHRADRGGAQGRHASAPRSPAAARLPLRAGRGDCCSARMNGRRSPSSPSCTRWPAAPRTWPRSRRRRAASASAAGACWRRSASRRSTPTLCARCADAVESGLVCRPAA